MKQKQKFPKDFLWGSATSAHQVEGNCNNSWSEWEKENAEFLASEAEEKYASWLPSWERIKDQAQNPENYISGRACDHYNRFEEDFDIAKTGGHNAHRFSIEWSRIEPEEGKFDEKEIEHYRKVIQALKDRNLEPFVTLWHWTNPLWIRDMGGWENKKTVNYFLKYVEEMVRTFPEVRFWIVLNEPTVYTSLGYIKGTQPPGKNSIMKSRKVMNNLMKAYSDAYDLIHSINSKAKVSVAYSINYWIPYKDKFTNKILASLMEYVEGRFLKKIKDKADFIGLQYYRPITIGFKKGGNFLGIVDNNLQNMEDTTDLGWNFYPRGMYYFLKKVGKYKLPVYITENGIADADDSKRQEFIKKHLEWIGKAIEEGVDVRGYFYWSLLDNFEFVEIRGFWPRFGLVEIDYKTLERKPRPSYYWYRDFIRNQNLEL